MLMLITILGVLMIPSIFSAPNATICDVYNQVEAVHHCGSRGYPLGYGLKNCLAFNNPAKYNLYTPEGQAFIDCTGPCLAEKITEISAEATSCSNLKTQAFNSHVTCYLQCGFCNICSSDRNALLQTLSWTDFFSLDAINQVFQIMNACGLGACF